MIILGIETSCDETAAAVVRDGTELLSNVVHSQIDLHSVYGGVVPEIAARSHLEVILPVVENALSQASISWDDVDAIAVTKGPGLLGSLLIGTLTARMLALLKNKPLYPVHHVEAHVYASFLHEKSLSFPLLSLIVSGGHSQLVLFHDHGKYEMIGQTQDDAVGEAFDKVAKVLGLPYPGGPSVSKAAEVGNPDAYKLPKAKLKNPYDYSFSGLKTAVLRRIQAECGVGYDFPSFELSMRLSEKQIADFAASFQQTAIDTLVDGLEKACLHYSPASVVVAGGVAANQALRKTINNRITTAVHFPPIQLCTDNAAMIATLGLYQSQVVSPVDPRELSPTSSMSMSTSAWARS